MIKGARLFGPYRYRLWRTWGEQAAPHAVFIMLNPSTADGEQDDPTIRKCMGFARRWGLHGIRVVNLFAWRATDPKELSVRAGLGYDIVGPDNDAFIMSTIGADSTVVAAWGTHGKLNNRWLEVTERLVFNGVKLHHLGICNNGMPRHPLMLKYDTQLEEWR